MSPVTDLPLADDPHTDPAFSSGPGAAAADLAATGTDEDAGTGATDVTGPTGGIGGPEEAGAAEQDAVVAALDSLDERIEANVRDERTLQRRVRRLRAARKQGRPWRSILDAEPDPGALHLVGQILARLSESSGVLRRALAHALRAEGETVPGIARRFGVTHQRVSSLLRRSRPD